MNKYAAITELESQLRAVEEEHCFALREGNKSKAYDLWHERGAIIWELQKVGQP